MADTTTVSRKEALLAKIDQLKTKFANPAYPDDLDTINGWESNVKRALIQDSLKDHEAIKQIVDSIKTQLEEIDFVLLNKTGLNETERDIILVKKQMHEWYLKLLRPNEDDLSDTEAEVDVALAATE